MSVLSLLPQIQSKLISGLFFTISLLIVNLAFGQSDNENELLKNRISPLMGFSFIPDESAEDGDPLFNIIPSVGFDYERWFNEKWAIGWFNEIELATYYIADYDVLKRQNAIITSITAIYSVNEYFKIFAGPGYEFEKHQNFFVSRLGAEYEIPIRNNWDVSLSLIWDNKEVYDSFC